MSIRIKQGHRSQSLDITEAQPEGVCLPPLLTGEQAQRMLQGLMKLVSINPTPGLLERWAAGQMEAGVICPECGGDWSAWVARERRRKELDLLPWEENS